VAYLALKIPIAGVNNDTGADLVILTHRGEEILLLNFNSPIFGEACSLPGGSSRTQAICSLMKTGSFILWLGTM